MVNDRLITPAKTSEDEELYKSLRPQSLDDFVGQKTLCENLRVFVEAAKTRGDALDHILLFGPPGLGKTTIGGHCCQRIGGWFSPHGRPHDFQSG